MIASEERTVQGIQSVTLATIGDLTIELGDQESLRIEAEDNILPYIETQVSNGMLTIQNTSSTNLNPTKSIRYHLTMTSLEALYATSIGNINAPVIQAKHFTIEISSIGKIHLAGLYADSLTVNIRSSGDLDIDEGAVSNQDITISSSGDYMAENVSSQIVDIRISSSGIATIWVTESLYANLSSSGNVNYYGRPTITQQMTSSGKVVSLGEK